jgi:phenylacetate-CoA ligase
MRVKDKTALQSERLKSLVGRVYDSVPSYRKKMDHIRLKPKDITSVADLPKLPFTTKADLRDNYPYGLFAVPRERIARIHASSGTTGKMTVVGYSAGDLKIWGECMARSLVMAGAKRGSIVHNCYGYGLFTGGLGVHTGAEYLGATIVPASSGNTKRQITLIRDLQADIITCTPSYAIYIAEEMIKEGVDISKLSLKAGMFGAEPWTDGMRKEIETKLNIKAYDLYGLSEILGPSVSMECPRQNGMHIQDDHFIAEIIDPDTFEPLAYGEEGELVFTTITKEGMPLIRYRTRDLCTLYDDECACGRTTVRMGKVKGRTDDMLIIRGVNVFPSQIEAALLNVRGVSPHYQIIVDRLNNQDKLTINVEMQVELFGDTIGEIEEVKHQLEKEVNDTLGIFAVIKLVEPNNITRSEGKAKRIIDNRNIK